MEVFNNCKDCINFKEGIHDPTMGYSGDYCKSLRNKCRNVNFPFKKTKCKKFFKWGYMEWWNSMSFQDQFFECIKWLSGQGRNTTDLHPHRIKKEEINQIYLSVKK